jgi:acetyl-CoA carboxylase biotin carboxyl carrier protein
MVDKKKKPEVSSGESFDVEAVRQLVEVLESSEVTRFDWVRGGERLSIRRGPQTTTQVVHQVAAPVSSGVSVAPAASVPPAPKAEAKAASAAAKTDGAEKKGHVITSPFVGTFYRSPAPDQPVFIDVGSTVKKGQILCIVEAMKLMNEIESEVAGKMVEVLAQNGQPVEFGQALFRIEPS